MFRYQGIDKIESQPQSLRVDNLSILRAEKTLGQASLIFGRYSNALIFDRDFYIIISVLKGHRHRTILRTILDGIADQIRKHLFQAFLVTQDFHTWFQNIVICCDWDRLSIDYKA